MKYLDAFNRAIRHKEAMDRAVATVNFKLRKLLGDGTCLFFQPGDGWCIIFNDQKGDDSRNAPIGTEELEPLLAMTTEQALALLNKKSI
jgi:hypothetical protein